MVWPDSAELVPNREWWPLKLVIFTQNRPKIDRKEVENHFSCSVLALFSHYQVEEFYSAKLSGGNTVGKLIDEVCIKNDEFCIRNWWILY